jgi:hypothetical protein
MTTTRRQKNNFEPISGFPPLMPEDRERFSEEVSKIVGSSDLKVCARFVEAIDEAAGEYLLVERLSEADRRILEAKTLLRLAENAIRTADALDELDRTSASALAWALKGKLDPTPSPHDIKTDAARLRSISSAATALAKSARKRQGGNSLSPVLSTLISKIALSYASSFRRRPSNADGSIFPKLLKAFFRCAKIGRAPEKTALKTVLSGLRFDDLPPLKRGRKSNPK